MSRTTLYAAIVVLALAAYTLSYWCWREVRANNMGCGFMLYAKSENEVMGHISDFEYNCFYPAIYIEAVYIRHMPSYLIMHN